MFRFAIIAALAALSGCSGTPYSAETSQVIDRTFTVYSFGTKSGDTDLAVAGLAKNNGGRVMLCAAAGADGNPGFEPRWPAALLGAMSFRMDGDLIGRRADFGSEYPGTTELVGQTAGCATTDAPWKANYARKKVRMELGRVRLID